MNTNDTVSVTVSVSEDSVNPLTYDPAMHEKILKEVKSKFEKSFGHWAVNPNDKSVMTKWVKITPDLAGKIMQLNSHNRKLAMRSVGRIAKDLLEGNYVTTHQGIAFTNMWVLVDGQHRLQGIIDSGVSMTFLVTVGLGKRAVQYVDGQIKPRTVSDAIALGHNRADLARTPVTTAAVWVRTGMTSFSGNLSLSDKVKTVFKYEKSLLWMADHYNPKVKGLRVAPARGAIARAHAAGSDLAKLQHACEFLLDPSKFVQGQDEPLMELREYLLAGGKGHGGSWMEQSTIYKKSTNALHAYLTGRQLKRLDAAKTDFFPLGDDDK